MIPLSRKGFPALLGFFVAGIGLVWGFYPMFRGQADVHFLPAAIGVILGTLIVWSMSIAAEWDRAVILRLGRYAGMRGGGLFAIIPVVDTIAYWIDTRVATTPFTAEQTLTKDGVPVNVDAVLFWKVVDPAKAALSVEDYRRAVSWAAQTALREVIGHTGHEGVLSSREKLDQELLEVLNLRTRDWGCQVISTQIRDIVIPPALQDAISMQAQAERERQARVILGDSERQIASQFVEASKLYANNPTALHLRAMNMLYEALRERGATIIVPSTAVETMGLGTLTGLTALSREALQQSKADEAAA